MKYDKIPPIKPNRPPANLRSRGKRGRRGYVYPFRCNHREVLAKLAKKKGQSMSAYLNGLISVEAEKEGIR